jgi:hypothetical protein
MNLVTRPLRKLKPDGSLYARREVVEAEISSLEQLDEYVLEVRCGIWPKTKDGFVSTEALLYFVRSANCSDTHRERLLLELLRRVQRLLPKPESGKTAALTIMNIRDEVRDKFVDLLLADQNAYDERLDYYEVNFNNALKYDRIEVSRKHWTNENRNDALGSEDGEVSAEVELAVGGYDPFDPDELDKKDYRRLLDSAIDTLPELQKRIVEMRRQDIPIDSSDPSVVTISKVLGKSEKTIRTHRDKAFAKLRRLLERKEIA